jgi:hypothetical protein
MDSFPVNEDVFEAPLFIKPLNLRLNVSFMQEGDATRPTARQLSALEHFQSLPTTLPTAIQPHALKYCDRIDDIVCLADEGIDIDRENIAKHYRFTDLVIPPLADTSASFFFLNADCDWEPEHGMQIVLDGHLILYCDDHTTLAFGAAWTRIMSDPNTERSAALRVEIAKL